MVDFLEVALLSRVFGTLGIPFLQQVNEKVGPAPGRFVHGQKTGPQLPAVALELVS